jgi:Probable zinc-ribbon domain
VSGDDNDDDGGGARVCVDCATAFVIGSREACFYRDRGLELPKRCAACRQLRRREKEQREAWPR